MVCVVLNSAGRRRAAPHRARDPVSQAPSRSCPKYLEIRTVPLLLPEQMGSWDLASRGSAVLHSMPSKPTRGSELLCHCTGDRPQKCVTVPESGRGCSEWEKNGGRTGQGWSSLDLGNVKFEDSHQAHDEGVFVKMKYSVYTQVGMTSNF